MENLNDFEKMAKHGGRFPPEAYSYLYCHHQFPADVDRVLYIDAGDVIIHGDISEYYFANFEDKSFIVTPDSFAVKEADGLIRPLNKSDLNNRHIDIIRQSYVNSGCIVLNLNKLRNQHDLLTRYENWVAKLNTMDLKPIQGVSGVHYLGDQGLFGLTFIDDMKFFAYNEVIEPTMQSLPSVHAEVRNLYSPYNFGQWAYETKESSRYTPIVLHYASPISKPWSHRYTKQDIENPEQIKLPKNTIITKNHRQLEMHFVWWSYHLKTAKKREECFAKLNPYWFLSEYYLDQNNFELSKINLNKVISLANTKNSNVMACLCNLQMRIFMKNADYTNAISIANEFLSNYPMPSYESMGIYCYKGLCYKHLKNYKNAAEAYENGYLLLDSYQKGLLEATELMFAGFSVPSGTMGKHFYAQSIAEFYAVLGEFDKAFLWQSRLPLTGGDSIKEYFRLINESGQNRIHELFTRISKISNQEILEACLAAFDNIVLPNPHVLAILAPFFNKYTELIAKRIKPTTSIHQMAHYLNIFDEMLIKRDIENAVKHLKLAMEADPRFISLMKERMDKFNRF